MGPVKVLTTGSLKAQMQFESANRHKRRKTKQNQPPLVGKGFLSFLLKRDSAGKTGPATLWSNTAPCCPQKPKRRKPGRKVIVSAGFSRKGLDSVDAKVKGDARKDQRKEGNLWTGSGQTIPGQRAVRGTIAKGAGSQGVREDPELGGRG